MNAEEHKLPTDELTVDQKELEEIMAKYDRESATRSFIRTRKGRTFKLWRWELPLDKWTVTRPDRRTHLPGIFSGAAVRGLYRQHTGYPAKAPAFGVCDGAGLFALSLPPRR